LRGLARLGRRAQDHLDKLLGTEDSGQIVIHLTDPVGDDGSLGPSVLAIAPESPDTDLVELLTELRLRRVAPAAAGSVLLSRGVAGYVANLAAGIAASDHDAPLKEHVEGGADVTIFSANVPVPVATSFVAWVAAEFGADKLGRFFKTNEEGRPDAAAQDVFHRPIGGLEEAWLGELRQPAGASPLRDFIRQVIPLLRPHWRRQLELGAYRFIGLGYGLLVPLAGKYLIDDIIPSGEVSRLTVFVVVLAAIYVVNAVIELRSSYVQTWLNLRILGDLQRRMFEHLQQLSHGFYSRAKLGDIMTRLTSDMQIVQQAMTTLANNGIVMVLTAMSAAVTLFVLSHLLALLVLVVVPAFVFSYLALQKRFRRASYERQRIAGETTNLVAENLSAQTVVKAYGMEAAAQDAFSARLDALFKSTLRLTFIGSVFQTSMTLASTLGQLLVFGVGGYLVIDGTLTIGTLLAFIALIPNLFHPLAALSSVGQQVEMASGSMQRITELLNEPVEIGDAPGAVDLPPLSKGLSFDDVSFGYGGQRDILKGLSLEVHAGSHVAIVGPSGAGKSTIVNLAMRFWDPDSGTIRFDGVDLSDATIASLRSQTGLVFQDTFIFDTTVRENIAIGRPGATDEEVLAVVRASALDGFVDSLPAGLDTVLGERGVRMSGGQRQRLAIARALLRNPRLLILDEATSALDAKTEQEIVETLLDLARGRTTITITHRLGLAARSDRIVAIANGAVVEEGTHEELLARDGLYKALHDEQSGVATRRAPVVQIARLREVPLFDELTADMLASIAQRLTPERFAAGDDIVLQGELGDKFYVIGSGSAGVLVDEGLGPREVNTLREGDFFGELALLSGGERTATVRAAEPSELFSLSHDDLATLMEIEPSVRTGIETVLEERRANVAAAAS
jgi:ATP-binding cassette subfamily B protein